MHPGLAAATGVVVGIAADELAFKWLNTNLAPLTCASPQSLVECTDFAATYQAHFNMALGIGLVAGLLWVAALWVTTEVLRQRRAAVA